MGNNFARALSITLLIVTAVGLSIFGRLGLDWLVATMPEWATQIERFGGWALGMVIGLAVVLPVFRMYGVFDKRKRCADGDDHKVRTKNHDF